VPYKNGNTIITYTRAVQVCFTCVILTGLLLETHCHYKYKDTVEQEKVLFHLKLKFKVRL